MKAAIYARYSSDNQREASIADQFRICREFARRQDWDIAKEYSDHAISGATLMRPGFQAMMQAALRKDVDVVLAESLDRFSRDQEDTAGLFKRLTFAGVSIVTLAEGDITFLHIGLKGTMNAMFLKELADKTRRGLRGRIEAGRSGGGLCYGYRILRRLENGIVTTGEREIEKQEAVVVRRIFRNYARGVSPKQIAKALNQEGVAGPQGTLWNPSTIQPETRQRNSEQRAVHRADGLESAAVPQGSRHGQAHRTAEPPVGVDREGTPRAPDRRRRPLAVGPRSVCEREEEVGSARRLAAVQ